MTVKTRNSKSEISGGKISNPLMAIEEKIKIYVWKIFNLQESNDELVKSVSDMRSENFRLKKELEKFTGNQGSVVMDRKTEFLDKDQTTQKLQKDPSTKIINRDDASTQLLNPGTKPGSSRPPYAGNDDPGKTQILK